MLVDLNVDAVGVGVGGGILPVERGEGGGLEDGRVEPEDASRAGRSILVEDNGEGRSRSRVLEVSPLVLSNVTSNSLTRADGSESRLAELTSLVGRADTDSGSSLASSSVSSALRGARVGTSDGSRDLVVARSETEDTNVVGRLEGVGDDDLSIGGVSDITVQKVEARRFAAALDVNVAVLTLGVGDADGHGGGSAGGDRVVVPLARADRARNGHSSDRSSANDEISSHLVAGRTREASLALANVGGSVASSVRISRALVGASKGRGDDVELPTEGSSSESVESKVVSHANTGVRDRERESATDGSVGHVPVGGGRDASVLDINVNITSSARDTFLSDSKVEGVGSSGDGVEVVKPLSSSDSLRLPSVGGQNSTLIARASIPSRAAGAGGGKNVALTMSTAIMRASSLGRGNLQTVLGNSDVTIDCNDEVGALGLGRDGQDSDATGSSVGPIVDGSSGQLASLTDVDIGIRVG